MGILAQAVWLKLFDLLGDVALRENFAIMWKLCLSWLVMLRCCSCQNEAITLDWNSPLWDDKQYQPQDRVVVSGVNNLPDDSVMAVKAFDHGSGIFVLRDGKGE